MNGLTPPQHAAAQAYVRLLQSVRAALADPEHAARALPLLNAPMAEADEALHRAGLAGNERHLLDLIYELPCRELPIHELPLRHPAAQGH
ncbi:hypothetical protein ACQB60_15115 [Actinomycetota bacterium Odt1-20B]